MGEVRSPAARDFLREHPEEAPAVPPEEADRLSAMDDWPERTAAALGELAEVIGTLRDILVGLASVGRGC